ncbi:MAG: 50S ribosomal protein L17 [Deltaproteobacteria bacterium]|nr:50S ribosomal protein L17 [Deltaproteobacteria bacterium]
MRHRNAGLKLGRSVAHRDALFRNLVTALFEFGKIRTTDAKAKELRRWADQMVTLAKRGDLHARRQAMAVIRKKDIVHHLFFEASGRFGQVDGGYTRITKIGLRPGDKAPISLIELVGEPIEFKKEKRNKTFAGRKKADKKAAGKEKAPEAPAKAAEPVETPA